MSIFDNIQIEGLGLVSTTVKNVVQSNQYDHLLPQVDWKQRIVRYDGDVFTVISEIKKVIFEYKNDTKKLTRELLQGYNTADSCRKVWEFWYNRCYYKEDTKGLEQLRRPARSYLEGNTPGQGIDCDDFSIAVSTCLLHLNIPHVLRIARYYGKTYFQHIYIVAYDGNREIYLDCVLDRFDKEFRPIAEIKDFSINANHIKTKTMANLSGIDIAVLSGLPSSELIHLVTGSDFQQLSGFGSTSSQEENLNAIYNYLKRTRGILETNPELVKEVENPADFKKMVDYALQHWHTPNRDKALAALEQAENTLNGLHGVSGDEETIDVSYFPALSGMGALGKIKAPRKFFGKVKQAAQNVGEKSKEAIQAVVKYNPLTLAARAGVLLAMKVDLFNLAEKIKFGYLDEKKAAELGLNTAEYHNAVAVRQQVEKMFEDVLQGDKAKLQDAIINGKSGGLGSIDLGALGIEPVTTAAATTAAATPFIVKIKDFAKKIDFKKMIEKVNPKKLIRSKNPTGTDTSSNSQSRQMTTTNNTNQTNTSTNSEQADNNNNNENSESSSMMPVLLIGGAVALAAFASSSKKRKAGLSGLPKKRKGAKAGAKKKSSRSNKVPTRLAGTPKKKKQSKTQKKGKGQKPRYVL